MPAPNDRRNVARRIWGALGIGWKIVVGIGVILGIVTGVLALSDRGGDPKAQADKVSASVVSGPHSEPAVSLNNDSSQPVSRVVVTLIPMNAEGQPIISAQSAQSTAGFLGTLTQLPPGHWWDFSLSPSNGMGGVRPVVELAFTDQNGKHWKRTATGQLVAIGQSADRYYHLPEPQSWGEVSRRAP